jgi:hypothetical protein
MPLNGNFTTENTENTEDGNCNNKDLGVAGLIAVRGGSPVRGKIRPSPFVSVPFRSSRF